MLHKYDFNILRTGLYRESKEFYEKAELLSKIEKICRSKKINVMFDVHVNIYTNFMISLTGTNYGIYMQFPNTKFDQFIFNKYIYKKKLEKKMDIVLKNYISKYNENTIHKFDSKVDGVAVIPNSNKTNNLDFIKLNKFIENKNHYIKIHPVISSEFLLKLEKKYGKEKLIPAYYDLTDIIKNTKRVAITSNTESMIPASLYNKEIYLLGTENLSRKNTQSTYEFLYLLLKNNIKIQDAFQADLLGLIPWELSEDINYIEHKLKQVRLFYEQWRDTVYHSTFEL